MVEPVEPDSGPHLSRPQATILVVEDDPSTREFYAQALRTAGYRVVAVEDGIDALRHVDQGSPPDAVVLDLVLPRLSGVAVYKELRARSHTRTVPIVVVTGADTRQLAPSGFRCCLRKPIYADALVSVVDDALQAVRRSITET